MKIKDHFKMVQKSPQDNQNLKMVDLKNENPIRKCK